MKRLRAKLAALAGGTTVAAAAGLPISGCESGVFDPQTFFEENTCNIFNCETLFFLQGDYAEEEDHADEEVENHTHE